MPTRNVRFKPTVEISTSPLLSNSVPASVLIGPYKRDISMFVPSDHTTGLSRPHEYYRLVSSLSKVHSLPTMTEKVLNTDITLSMGELLAVLPDLASELTTKCRCRRVPINNNATTNLIEVGSENYKAEVNSVGLNPAPQKRVKFPPLYACASPHAECVLGNSHSTDLVIDSGSDINVMTKALWEEFNLPIDI